MSTFAATPVLSRRARAETIEVRVMAKQVVDLAVAGLGRPIPASRTEHILLLGAVAALIGAELGWDDGQVEDELDRYRALVDSETDSAILEPEPSR